MAASALSSTDSEILTAAAASRGQSATPCRRQPCRTQPACQFVHGIEESHADREPAGRGRVRPATSAPAHGRNRHQGGRIDETSATQADRPCLTWLLVVSWAWRQVAIIFVVQAGYYRERRRPTQVQVCAAFLPVPGDRHLQAVSVGTYRVVVVLFGQFQAIPPSSAAVVIDAFDHDITGTKGTGTMKPDDQSVNRHTSPRLPGAQEIRGLAKDALLARGYPEYDWICCPAR